MKRIKFITAILLMVLASAASAQIPNTINYQGVLTDNSGVVVPDGSYDLTLRLYTVETGGSPVWDCTETVTVSKGIFNAVLGSSCVLTPDFNQLYYLGISVEGGAELAPRTPLTSAAYSIGALSVTGAENVFPSDGNVGIGTTTPPYRLTIHGNSQVGIRYNGYDSSWASIYTNGAAGGRPTYGYMRNNVLLASTYLAPGNNWILRFSPNDVFSVSSLGHTGIGAGIYPGAEMLTVGGAVTLGNSEANTTGTLRWTGSDFEGYDGSAWQSLTGGGGSLPAGTDGQTLRHNGTGWVAAGNLTNDGSKISLGSEMMNGHLDLYQDGSVDPVITLTQDGIDGGGLYMYDSAGNLSSHLGNDASGDGGYFFLRRNATDYGFLVDGNRSGSENTSVTIYGGDRLISLNTSSPGDESAVLPAGAVASDEILNEAGVASNGEDAYTDILDTPTVILVRSITVPAAGYVMVTGSAQVTITHANGTSSRADFGVSNLSSSLPANQDLMIGLPSGASTGFYYFPVTPHGMFEVPSAGTHTFYFLGELYDAGADIIAWDPQLTLVYLPTSYGTVVPTLAGSGNTSEQDAGTNPGKTAADIAAERAASIADNDARIRRELETMRREIEELKSKVRESE